MTAGHPVDAAVYRPSLAVTNSCSLDAVILTLSPPGSDFLRLDGSRLLLSRPADELLPSAPSLFTLTAQLGQETASQSLNFTFLNASSQVLPSLGRLDCECCFGHGDSMKQGAGLLPTKAYRWVVPEDAAAGTEIGRVEGSEGAELRLLGRGSGALGLEGGVVSVAAALDADGSMERLQTAVLEARLGERRDYATVPFP